MSPERFFGTDSSSGASVLLGPATVGFLRDVGEEVGFSQGDVIVRRGDEQEFFYVVIDGEVELLLSEGEGMGRPLARIGEGGIFGAESALGRGGAAIGAVAVTDVRLLRYPASALPTALQESASLRKKLLGGIARHLQKTTSDALDLMHGAEVMARLVQGDTDPDELIAASPRMKAIKKKLPKIAESDEPVLLIGEDGTGKTLIATHLKSQEARTPGSYPNTRFIITAHEAAIGDSESGLTNDLAKCIEDPITIPPLGKRLKDILPLAEDYLAKRGPDQPIINEGARHALLSLRYQRRNVAELREVLELATRVAEGNEIRAEHIFGGVGEDALVPGMDITNTPLMRRLLHRATLPALRIATLAGFLGIIGVCLSAPSSVGGRAANTAIWSMWEPAVFALFFLVGPVWCTICPLSTAARWSKKLHHSKAPPPEWLIRHGPWMAIVGFALIIWVERVFNSAENPVASGFLLLSLVVASVGVALLFRREAWCRHLCPLGRLGTSLAPAAPFQLVAKSRVCASTCTTHACYRGTQDIPGCTVFHHPLEGKQAYRCKLCLDCLKSCPHHSANVQLRPALMAVWRLDSSASDLSVFALTVALLALGLVASRTYAVLADPVRFTSLFVLTIVGGVALHSTIMALAKTERKTAIMVRIGMSLMILGWAALMTSQLANIVVFNDARVTLPAFDLMPSWIPTEFSVLIAFQLAIVLFALLLSLVSLGHVNFRGTTVWTRIGRW
ncbi:MAG: cyclic nucleotide-binding domain-containing protein, partial [Acidobacteriota bacterium]